MPKITTREKLLRSAINLFYEKGYADTSIRQIGAKAGITNSLVYHYFKNKEEMLFEIVSNASQGLLDALLEIERNTPDPLECLRKMLVTHTALISIKTKKESKILSAENYWIRGKNRKIIKRQQREIYDVYMGQCKKLKQMGLINEVDLTVLNFSIFGVINWFFRWYREGGRLTKKEVAENIWKFVFHGILKSEP